MTKEVLTWLQYCTTCQVIFCQIYFQGDGTAFIFRDTDSVFTFSMHCGKNFPFRKQNSDLDVALEVNIGDSEYLSILQVGPSIRSQEKLFQIDLLLLTGKLHDQEVVNMLSPPTVLSDWVERTQVCCYCTALSTDLLAVMSTEDASIS